MSAYGQLLTRMMDAILKGDTSGAPALLRDKKDFPPEAQLAVYTEGYRLRLLGALEATYPALFHYLGTDDFGVLAKGFIAALPSRFFNLDQYAIGFGPYVVSESKDDFARELAQLESAVHDVYQREETPAMTSQWAQEQSPGTLVSASFRLRSAAQLLAFSHPVNAYFSAFRDGKKPEKPLRERSWALVLRHHHQVKRLMLDEAEYHLLALFVEGSPLEEALDDMRLAPFAAAPDFALSLQGWFARWVNEGVLRQPV